MKWIRLLNDLLFQRLRRAALPPTLASWIYLLFAGCCTLLAARAFFDARAFHLGFAEAARSAADASSPLRGLDPIWWSAPLDDTFIHFDFARSFARFHPFEWTPGGGYSSGATSWLYPALLALGIPLGFDGQWMGFFADWLATVGVFTFLWASRSLFCGLPSVSTFVLPPAILTSGVLGWSLWSGMELAVFLAVWGACAHAFVELRRAKAQAEFHAANRRLMVFGLLLVMTRPEALFCVGLFALFGHIRPNVDSGRPVLYAAASAIAPALAFTFLRALVNLVLTGSFADAGAIVKLETLHPFHEAREMALRWFSHVGFQLTRITIYHTIDDARYGFTIWILAALGFFDRRTRHLCALLWLSAIGWILIVAQNEYVRYQNDRYTMPAVTWLIVSAVLGTTAVLDSAWKDLRTAWSLKRWGTAVLVCTLAFTYAAHQQNRWEQQKWLFGRASKNIAEQQVRTGQLLGAGHFGHPRRVLLGDAGAIPFFSGLPALDSIGLGGTHGLPFSRAVRLGVGATVELIEHLEPEDRPDLLAIYPSWWELLPVWFGRPLGEIRIRGNVICGAANKVVYQAIWRGLDDSPWPSQLDPAMRIVDEFDFADVMSESAHGYEISERHAGYVVMKLLPHPVHPHRELFDAGRLVFDNTTSRFQLRGLEPGRPAELVFRAAPTSVTRFKVRIDGHDIGRVEIDGADEWQEPRLPIPLWLVRSTLRIEIIPEGTENILYHLWVVSPR
jgi:hypothetical protein